MNKWKRFLKKKHASLFQNVNLWIAQPKILNVTGIILGTGNKSIVHK